MIDCREAVRRMWTYLEGALEAEPVEEFETHLGACRRCCGELEFHRQLRDVVAEREGAPPIPEGLRSRIEILLAQAESAEGGAR